MTRNNVGYAPQTCRPEPMQRSDERSVRCRFARRWVTEKFSTLYIGLVVHETGTEVATAHAAHDGDVKRLCCIGADLATQGSALRKLVSKGSHLKVNLNGHQSVLPMHAAELKKGTVEAIKKQLDLK